MTRATVLIPTFNHAATLGLTVESVLAQTLQNFEVLIVGDGVTSDVREVARSLDASDERVRFLDFPKGPNHGEIHRHTAIEQSAGEIIAYLCDDDLLLPDHLADLSALLDTHDFVQSLNGHIDPEGVVHLWVGDLADPECVSLVCDPDQHFNFVGITGTAHTRALYDRAQSPWQTTPSGIWPDHHQWRRMLGSGSVRAATSTRMTALSFPTHLDGRGQWTDAQRADEVGRWAEVVQSANAQAHVDALTTAATWRQLVSATVDAHRTRHWLDVVNAELGLARRSLLPGFLWSRFRRSRP